MQSSSPTAVEHRPEEPSTGLNPLFLLIPGVAGVAIGAYLIYLACRRSPRCSRWWAQRWRRWQESRWGRTGATWQLPGAAVAGLGRSAQRYTRHASAS